jgi:hypothetical protein
LKVAGEPQKTIKVRLGGAVIHFADLRIVALARLGLDPSAQTETDITLFLDGVDGGRVHPDDEIVGKLSTGYVDGL